MQKNKTNTITIKRVKTIEDARATEKFIFDAIKPGGFADAEMPIPSLKDHLAWLSYANLRRAEQPSFIAIKNGEIIAGVFGEPIEQYFDEGESEIQELIIKPGEESDELINELLTKLMDFYTKNHAKQVHFWIRETNYKSGNYASWKKLLIERFGFKHLGFAKISKWTGVNTYKIENVL